MSRQLQLRHLVGQRIAKKRKEAKLPQSAIAERVNLSTEGYARYERGESTPDIIFLDELAQIFGCQLAELVIETSPGLSSQAQHIAHLMEGVSSSDRDEIVKIVEGCCALAHKKQMKSPKGH